MFRPVVFGSVGIALMLPGWTTIWHRSGPAGRDMLLALGVLCAFGLRAWHVVTGIRDRNAGPCPSSLYLMSALLFLTCAACFLLAWGDVRFVPGAEGVRAPGLRRFEDVLSLVVVASLVRAAIGALAASVPRWRPSAAWFIPRPPWCPNWFRPGGFASWWRAVVIG